MPDNEEIRNSGDEELKARLVELEGVVGKKDEEFSRASTRIVELERLVAEANDRADKLGKDFEKAVSGYKALVVRSNPDVLEELIAGDSIEAIDSSLASARELVSKVRKGVENEISLVKVPAGAPQRTSVDLSALSPREKIQYGIGGKR